MKRRLAAAFFAASMSAAVLTVSAAALDRSISVGGRELQLAGHGTRTELLFVELYKVGLYLPRDMSDPAAIQGASIPKAVRVQVRYDGSMPDRIPTEWRHELMPALTQAQQQKLRQHYAKLSQGDTVTVRYAPGTGTTVTMNGATVLEDKGHEVMNAFLDLWIGQNPVSQELKQSLLG